MTVRHYPVSLSNARCELSGPTTDSESDFQPVFVVGYGRSGTTLLTTILGRHPNLAGTPESHLMDHVLPRSENVAPPRSRPVEEMRERFLASPRSQDLEIAPEDLPKEADTYADFFEQILTHVAKREGKTRVVEKTPLHLIYTPTLLAWYPGARIVCIVRDGRDAVCSMMSQPWTHNDLRRHCRKWRWYAELAQTYEKQYVDRFIRVHYEDVVRDAEPVIRKIDDFIGESFAPEQLHWGDKQSAGAIPEWEKEWKAKSVEKPDTSRVGRWREDASKEDRILMNVAMGDALEAMGYSDTSTDEVSWFIKQRHRLSDRVYDIAYGSPLTRIIRSTKRVIAPPKNNR